MRCFVVPAVWLQACCVPLPFPHDHDTTDTIGPVDDDFGPPTDTSLPVTDTTDTADCPDGTYDGSTFVVAGGVDCNGDTAVLSADLFGWTDRAVVFLQETGAVAPHRSEEHPLHTSTRDRCGFDEQRRQELTSLGVSVDAWEAGESSVFPCATHLSNPLMMTVAIYVEDVDDGAGDCLAVGHDPEGLVGGLYDDARVGVDPTFDLSLCVIGAR
jgi:hypothetical protein